MKTSKKKYSEMVKQRSPNSPIFKNCIFAFFIGGFICCFGELLSQIYSEFLNDYETKLLVPVTLIVITAILTGTGIFDKIARYAGAGTVVPITGFANSIVSSAIEYQTEGRILGTAANMFKIAGPVIVYSTAAACLWGAIVYLFM